MNQKETKNYIKEAFNLSPIISMLKEANPNTLIIFDVDEVLIMLNFEKIFPGTTSSPCLDFVDYFLPNLGSANQLCIKLKINFCYFYYKAVNLVLLPKINKQLEILIFQQLL